MVLTATAPSADAGPTVLGRSEAAPRFDARDLDGRMVRLSQLLREGPVVVTFWATWCKPCVKELPALEAVVRERGGRVALVAVNEDGPRNRAKLRPFWKALGLTAPIVPDDDGVIAERYRVLAFPTTVLVDTLGRVASFHQGYRPGDEALLAGEIDRLLAAGASRSTSASDSTVSTPPPDSADTSPADR